MFVGGGAGFYARFFCRVLQIRFGLRAALSNASVSVQGPRTHFVSVNERELLRTSKQATSTSMTDREWGFLGQGRIALLITQYLYHRFRVRFILAQSSTSGMTKFVTIGGGYLRRTISILTRANNCVCNTRVILVRLMKGRFVNCLNFIRRPHYVHLVGFRRGGLRG